jgi:predicted DNA-binding transcriptional regulator AlpA
MDVPSEQSAEHHYLGQKAQPASSETRLPIFVRYKDIADAGICDSYRQLYNMIDNDGFPPGMLLSPNVRAWNVADIEEWLSMRPTARKMIAPHRAKEEAA